MNNDINLISRYITRLSMENKSEITINTYTKIINDFNVWVGETYGLSIASPESIKKINGLMLEDYQAMIRGSGYKPSTENLKIIPVAGFFRWVTSLGILDKDPSVVFITVKVVPEDQPHLEWKQVESLMQTYRSSRPQNQKRDLCILAIGFTMGLRVSGIAGLNISDYNGKQLTYTNKGGRRVTAYVPEFLREWLDDFIKIYRSHAKAEDPLFISLEGKRMDRKTIYNMCVRAGESIGVKMTPHAMRRSALTRASELQGIEMAQAIASHSSARTTGRYIYQSESAMDELYRDMDLGLEKKIEGLDEEKNI